MMARVELSNRKSGRERISMDLFLPVRTAKEVAFDPGCISGSWPPVQAHWLGKNIFGQVVWDVKDIIIVWNDGDETETTIPLFMDLHRERVLSFKSEKISRTEHLTIDAVEVL